MKATSTRNYSLFVHDVTNRPLDENHKSALKKLQASMEKYGFLPFPMLVKRSGAKFKILDGQHRFEIAQKLNLPVMYIETDRDDITIAECADAQRPWNIKDYIGSYAAQGTQAYIELQEFSDAHKMPPARAAALLGGNTGGGSEDRVKAGDFAIKDRKFAERVAVIIGSLRLVAPWCLKQTSIAAIARFVRVPDFSDAQMIERATKHPHLLKNQPTIESMSEMYEAVYNHASRTRLPLAFFAKESAQSRRVAGFTKEKRVLQTAAR